MNLCLKKLKQVKLNFNNQKKKTAKTNCKDHWDQMDPINPSKAGNQEHQK